MKRSLPEYVIEGTSFSIDVDGQMLVETANPQNTILFEEISYKGTHYEFEYDTTTRNLPAIFRSKPENVISVRLPQQVELDPAGMSAKYHIPVNEIGHKSDFDIIVDQQLLEMRKAGVLPIIDIAGHEFIIDIRLSELRPKNDFSTSIKLSDLDYSVERESYRAFYQPGTHSIVEIDPCSILEMPKDTVMIEIPFEWKLDPYGIAREKGLDLQDTLIKYPIQKDLNAKVVPLSMTNIPAIILENKKRNRMQGTKQSPIAKRNNAARKNKGRRP